MANSDETTEGQGEQTVPGVVRVLTIEPVEVPASVSETQGWLAEQVEERPWLVAAAIVVLFSGLLVVARRRR